MMSFNHGESKYLIHSMVVRSTESLLMSSKCVNSCIVVHVVIVFPPHPCSHESDKKPFLKVEGEWNGVMYTKHPNGVSQPHSQC